MSGLLGDSVLQVFCNPVFILVYIYIYILVLDIFFLLYDSSFFSLFEACIFVENWVSIYLFSFFNVNL